MTQLPDVRQLQIFLALEETRSFTAAANKLHITQSAVSHSIKSLENTMDCLLIERLGKKCILTPHGEVFLSHAKLAIKHLTGAVNKIKTLNAWGYSSLKIGVSHTFCQYVLPSALSKFYNSEKKCEVFVTTNDTRKLIDSLDRGDLDIAFGIRNKNLENEYQFHSLENDELCFITAPGHPWATNPPESAEDYEKERFIVYGSKSITVDILNSHLSGLGIKHRATISVGNVESIKEMVALKLGVGVTSAWSAKKEIDNKSLIQHAIKPAPIREWGYYLSKTKTLSLIEQKFIDIFAKSLETVIKGA